MNISNLVFFDKNGESYNLSQNSAGHWEGADYFLPVSIALFDCSNIFILEKDGNSYKFPMMEPGSRFEIIWETKKDSDNFFLFTVGREGRTPDNPLYINKQDSLTINYSDFGQTLTPLNLTYPMQLNVAFTPSQEKSYSRVLRVNYVTSSSTELVLQMTFYGEGEDEDERFRIWLQNFGVKFNKQDALILKDYDLKEGLVDWKQVNQARKNLLVNRDQVYPYIGTYKGLLNIIDLMGYADVLRVKEYWRDSDPNSRYYNNFAMVDITDIMQVGDITKLNLVDLNGQIKKGGKFKKTEFLALAYQFTVAGDRFDDDGLPEVISTTDFSVDEIFFKLHKFADKLKNEILPINVIIKDIIGEFIYFEKFTLRNWSDETVVEDFQINDTYKIRIIEPNQTALDLKIRDIKNLYRKLNGTSKFPALTYNAGTIDPYQNNQQYPLSSISELRTAITNYYNAITYQDFYQAGITSPLDNGDDTSDKIGCPVIFEAYVPDLTLQELDGVTFGDFIISSPTTSSTSITISTGSKTFSCVTVQGFKVGDLLKIYVSADPLKYMEGIITSIDYPNNDFTINITSAVGTGTISSGWTITIIDQHYTIANLKYKNSYEVEWEIRGPRGYFFTWRDRLPEIAKIPHILPNVGTYDVMVKVHDMHGGASIDYQKFTVKEEEPVLQGFIKLQDKFRYTFKNLHNVTIGDLGSSPLYDPYANILNANGEVGNLSEITAHYLDWNTYSNRFGVGGPQDEILIYDDATGYLPYSQSTSSVKLSWGSGSANGQATLKDYQNSQLQELYHQDFSDFGMVADLIDGFYLDLRAINPNTPNSFLLSLQYGGFTEIDVLNQIIVPSPDEILNLLQNTTAPGWTNYRYQLLGDRIKATAKFQDKKNHSIIKAISIVSGIDNTDNVYVPSYSNVDCAQTQFGEVGTKYTFTIQSPSSNYGFNFVNLNDGDRIRIQNQIGQWAEGIICDISNNEIMIVSDEINLTPTLDINSQISTDADSHSISTGSKSFVNITGIMTINPKIGTTVKIYDSNDISKWMIGTVTGKTAIALGNPSDSITVNITQTNGTGSSSGWLITVDSQVSNFDVLHIDKIYTFSRPKKAFNTQTVNQIQACLNQIGLQLDEDLLFLRCPFVDKLKRIQDPCTDAIASNINYWINRGYVSYNKTTGVQTGFLPSSYDENSFNLINIKSTYDTIVVPINHPTFITVANLASNIETEWTLFSGSTQLAKVKTPSYFIWRFNDPGEYQLKAKCLDARGNVFEMQTTVSATRVMTSKEYLKYIERHLNERKRILVGDHTPPQI